MLTALYAAPDGEIFDAPGQAAVARHGERQRLLKDDEVMPLPEGAELCLLPGRWAVTMNETGQVERLGPGLLAVAAILPMGYTRTLVPAFEREENAPLLPLFGYAAVALKGEELVVAAVPGDDNEKWHPYRYNTKDLRKKVKAVTTEMPQNRIVKQLGDCSLKWHCCTAQNLFYRRWEAGIPTSPTCNAQCLGCISLQPAECCPSPQSRIAFAPTAEEIAQVGLYHLETAPEGIISFGQGCEGEPALAYERIAPAMRQIRSQCAKGQININTNAGCTKGIKEIVDAGLDSMRVSIISAREAVYQAYYRAENYTLQDVEASIRYAKENGVYVSLNMLFFPGLNDRPEEIAAWEGFLERTGVDMIQLRNLNIDPDWLLETLPPQQADPIGVPAFLGQLAKRFPDLVLGSFSHYVKSAED